MKIEGNKFYDKLIFTPSKNKAQLEITTLGGLSIRLNGQLIAKLHSRKAEALLVYLAVTARPQPREVLADLLWEDFSQKRAMNNLRVVLSNLRKHLGDYLLITRSTAAMNSDVDYGLDVAVLDANLGYVGEIERKSGKLNRDAIAQIEKAIELYKGEFLSGFFVGNALEFDAWMVVERERFHHLMLDGLGKLVRWELSTGEYTSGIRHASKWVQLEPLSEAAHRQMMRLLAFSGERSAALTQYEKCRDILITELGVPPDARTATLYEQIRAGELAPDKTFSLHIHPSDVGAVDVRHHNLPVQTTPFIGRERELANLNQLLTDPDVRLVTVLGAGGMGKTRLALEVGEGILDRFPDGIFFVPLDRLRSADLIVPSMIQALGIEFAGGDAGSGDSQMALKESLLRNMRRKQMLIILDNFEHLLEGANLVGEIIQTAPGVKILATSRARLNLGGEHRVHVAGMDYPEDIKDDEVQRYSAVRLYLNSARRARSDFKLHPDEMQHIAKICQLLEGMPLGIRLAAAWVEILSPEEIAAEISQNLDLLETDLRDEPDRHRSIRALYDHSWNLLSPKEQEVFQAFSVFRGGCTREAAQEITGATLRDLKSLVDKSLLHRVLNGRYEIHEMTREYAAEKLCRNPELWESVYSRHSAYYNNAVRGWGDDLKSTRQLSALKEMDLEIDNARVAWSWAVEGCRADLLDMSIEGFRHYFAIRRHLNQAERAFRQAVECFDLESSRDELRVYARLISMQAHFSGENEIILNLYQQSLKILDKLDREGQDVRYEKAQTLNYLGFAAALSNFDQAIRFERDSLRLFKDLSDRYWIAQALYGLADTYFMWGRLDDAEKNYKLSMAVFKDLGDTRQIVVILGDIVYFYMRQSKFEKAERVARERLEICETTGDPSAIAEGQRWLGICLEHLGEFNKAETLLKNALLVHKELEHYRYFFLDLFDLCFTKLHLGKYEQAYDLAQSALDISNGLSHTSVGFTGLDTKDRRLGFALTIQGMATLALGRISEAEDLLKRSLEALREVILTSNSVYYHFVLGIVYIRLYQPKQAKEHIHDSLRKGVQISSAMVFLKTLGAAALYLADGGDLERGVEIYALARRYHWIAKSQWQKDVVERPLTSLTAPLSPEVIAAAQKRGRERDLGETVQELLAVFQ
jgi:predicted ATPase/DNA-binding SARP family transcriptional activator